MFQDINQIDESKEKVEQVQRQKQEYKYDFSQKRRSGHILFSYNVDTQEWKQAEVNHTAKLDMKGHVHYVTKCKREPRCIYIQALNLKNAQKKLTKYCKMYESKN